MITDPEARDAITGLLGFDLISGLEGAFAMVDIAEDEIEQATKRHPDQADLIYHGFKMLRSTHDLMSTELVYRAHCAELLDRLATGEDTRPGTDAEICCLCSDTSAHAPFTETGAGVYFRVFARRFPGLVDEIDNQVHHYEALHRSDIDDLLAEATRKVGQPSRVIPKDLTCAGRHHGEDVDCRFTPAAQGRLL